VAVSVASVEAGVAVAELAVDSDGWRVGVGEGAKMKKGLLAVIVAVGIVVLSATTIMGTYNRMITQNEGIDGQWAQVENQLQRRFDLIPNLVETVRGYAAHERAAIDSVTQARARLGGQMAPEQRMDAENQLSGALSRLLVIVENYPNLKADANFRTLMDQLEGTENRLAQERRMFNELVRDFNVTVQRFPTALIARWFGFAERAYFPALAGAETPPRVTFP